MLKSILEVQLFMKDSMDEFLDYEGYLYHKFKLSSNLFYLYRKKKPLLNSPLEFVGVYDVSEQGFVLISDYDYEVRQLLEKPIESHSLNHYSIYSLSKRLQKQVEIEFKNCFTNMSRIATVDDKYTEYVHTKAKEWFLKGTTPVFEFPKYEITINEMNLFEILTDINEFAYEFVEEKLDGEIETLKRYQEWQDIMNEIEVLNSSNCDILKVEQLFNEISCSDYKTINFTVDNYKSNTIETHTGQPLTALLKYPLYAIQTITWGRKKLYDRKDYAADAFDECKLDKKYYESFFKNANNFYTNIEYSSFAPEFFKDVELAKFFLSKEQYEFDRLDSSLRNNISFILELLDKGYDFKYMVSHIDAVTLLKNKTLVMQEVIKNQTIYNLLPEAIKSDEDVMCAMFDMAAKKDARTELLITEDMFNSSRVCEAMKKYFAQFEAYEGFPQDMLKYVCDEATLRIITTPSGLKYLPDTYRNSEDFIMDIVANKSNFISYYYFRDIYMQLDVLKNDKDFILRLFTHVKPYKKQEYLEIHEDIRNDLDFQTRLCNLYPMYLEWMSREVQKDFLQKNGENLKYITKKGDLVKSGEEKQTSCKDRELVEIAVASNYKALEYVAYSLRSDKEFMKPIIAAEPKAYKYLTSQLKTDRELALLATNYISIIDYLPELNSWNNNNHLFKDREIMERSLKHSPLDFQGIPTSTKRYNYVSFVDDVEFVRYAVHLDDYNIRYLSPKNPALRDFEITSYVLIKDLSHADVIPTVQFRDEKFVFTVLDELITGRMHKARFDKYMLSRIPKKITETKEFKEKYAMLIV